MSGRGGGGGGGLHWKEREPKDIHPTRNEKEIKSTRYSS